MSVTYVNIFPINFQEYYQILGYKKFPEYQPDTPGIFYSFTSRATASVHTVSQN